MAGIKAVFYSIVVCAFTYFFANWLFFKAPRSAVIESVMWWWPLILMWIPGVLAFLFRIFFKEGFRDAGWAVGKMRYWVLAVTVPLMVAVVSYAAAGWFGLAWLDRQSLSGPMFTDRFGILPASWPGFTPDNLTIRFIIKFSVVAVIGFIPEFIFGLGEELGWRGYLQTRLYESRVPFPLLIGGLVWSAWHLPWLIFTDRWEMLLFIVCILCLSAWIGWLREASGSVWVAAAAHAAHNAFLLTLFAGSFQIDQPYWVSETGVLTVIIYGLVSFMALKYFNRFSSRFLAEG